MFFQVSFSEIEKFIKGRRDTENYENNSEQEQ